MEENYIKINVTRKDKIYLSVIGVLVLICICLAIVLPRPYKTIEVEKPVYETTYQKVYDTQLLYLINPNSSFYNQESGYTDAYGNAFVTNETFNYIDTGDFLGASVSVKILEGGVETQKSIKLEENITNLIVEGATLNEFGVNIKFDYNILDVVNTIFINSLGDKKANPLDYYLFEIEFESFALNFIVCYISV